jgi:hypothetical protein
VHDFNNEMAGLDNALEALNDINVEGGFDGHDGAGWDCGGD